MLKSKITKIVTILVTAVTMFTIAIPAVFATDIEATAETVAAVEIDPNQALLNEIAALVNAERAKAGLSALEIYVPLQAAATIRATEASAVFAHTRPNGERWTTAFEETGVDYRYAGENLARGFKKAETLVNAWMNSESHKKNIMDGDFTHVAYGISIDENGKIAVSQLFITPKAEVNAAV